MNHLYDRSYVCKQKCSTVLLLTQVSLVRNCGVVQFDIHEKNHYDSQ